MLTFGHNTEKSFRYFKRRAWSNHTNILLDIWSTYASAYFLVDPLQGIHDKERAITRI